MIKIRKIGSVLHTDEDGYIVSQSSTEVITTPWLEAVEAVKQAYLEHYGKKIQSIYVRGSVSRGMAIKGVSDIDTLAVVNGSIEDVGTSWVTAFEEEFIKKFPFTTGAEIQLIQINELMDFANKRHNWDRLVIKTQCACIYGEDVAQHLQKFKPNQQAFGHAFAIEAEISGLLRRLDNMPSDQLSKECTWIMKRFVRSGYELVMEREQAYTRDLYPCYAGFAKYYPAQSKHMYWALEHALNPIADRVTLRKYLETFGTWLSDECADFKLHSKKDISA